MNARASPSRQIVRYGLSPPPSCGKLKLKRARGLAGRLLRLHRLRLQKLERSPPPGGRFEAAAICAMRSPNNTYFRGMQPREMRCRTQGRIKPSTARRTILFGNALPGSPTLESRIANSGRPTSLRLWETLGDVQLPRSENLARGIHASFWGVSVLRVYVWWYLPNVPRSICYDTIV